jgi:hypothetical protein
MATMRAFRLLVLALAISACSDSDDTGSDGAVVPGGSGGAGDGGSGGSGGGGNGGAGGGGLPGGSGGAAGAGGSGAGGSGDAGVPGTGGDSGGSAACMPIVASPASEGAAHTTLCGPVSYGSNPPASGTHYQQWPVFRAYDQPVPWGYLVHGLEHGAVVIVYNCPAPAGCPEEVAAAKAMIATLPLKAGCSVPPVILTPDPTLTTRWAASAWLHTLRATCFDKDAFAQFAKQYMNMGLELFVGDCGAVDKEAAGWCPAAPAP